MEQLWEMAVKICLVASTFIAIDITRIMKGET